MNDEFKPCREAFYTRLLWLAWLPAVIAICVGYWNVFPVTQDYVDLAVMLGTGYGICRAIRLNGRTLKFQSGLLIITDFLDEDREFLWKLIKHARIETVNRWPLPCLQILMFSYQEAGDFYFLLSDLSSADRLRAIRLLEDALADINLPEIKK